MTKGNVYILTNPCLNGWVKIGYTDKNDIKNRLNTLNSSPALPLSFRVYAILKVTNPKEVEQRIHRLLDIIDPSLHSIEKLANGKERVREFFQISPEKAYMIFKEVAIMMNILNDLTLTTPNQKEQEEENIIKNKRARSNFKDLGISIGSEISFFKDENIKCITHDDDNKVMFNQKITTLSAIAKELLGYNVSGPSVFIYNGETLLERRLRLEVEYSKE